MDYFLKATNEQELMAKLEDAGVVVRAEVKDEDGNIIDTRFSATEGNSLDLIGIIYKPTGNVIKNNDGLEFPEMVALDGFHANLRGNLTLGEKVEYIPYQPTEEELANPEFVMPEPEVKITPSPIADIIVTPKNPQRVWF